MNNPYKKLIVISAINIRAGGPLTILNSCLSELVKSDLMHQFKIVALVYKKELCHYEGVNYIEFANSNKRLQYFYYEYFGIRNKFINNEITLLISLTDKTPNLKAEIKTVYIHNPTPFFEVQLKDFFISHPFLALYKYFYAKLCAINVHTNKYIIVQQDWLRSAYSNLLNFPLSKIIVFPPDKTRNTEFVNDNHKINVHKCQTFMYASLPRSFKNFEIICEAVKIVNNTIKDDFKVKITLNGTENRYSRYIYRKYKNVENIEFLGLVSHEELLKLYEKVDCLVFPSRLETWGLAISEFSSLNKPMLLADLPYARNTAQGSKKTSFFDINSTEELAIKMVSLINGDFSILCEIPQIKINPPNASSWDETVRFLLNKYEKS